MFFNPFVGYVYKPEKTGFRVPIQPSLADIATFYSLRQYSMSARKTKWEWYISYAQLCKEIFLKDLQVLQCLSFLSKLMFFFVNFFMFYVFRQENRIIVVRPFFSIKWNITITLYCYLFWQSHILFLRQIQKIYILFHSSLQWLYQQIKWTCNDCQCLILVNEAPEKPILFKLQLQFISVSNFVHLIVLLLVIWAFGYSRVHIGID